MYQDWDRESEEERCRVRKALLTLPLIQRRIIVLAHEFYIGCADSEKCTAIGEVLNQDPSYVQEQLGCARRELRRLLIG